MIQVLSSRRKNRILLIGQLGVGKTALVHDLAQRITIGAVSDKLADKRLLLFDALALRAGAIYDGQFDERLRRVLEELRASTDILFVDDLADAMLRKFDRASILLTFANTGIPLIHALSTENFEKYLKSDTRVMNTFVCLFVQGLLLNETIKALHALRPSYEQFYRVSITDEAIEAATHLSDQYVKDGIQPDKSIQLIDEAASILARRQLPPPPQALKDDAAEQHGSIPALRRVTRQDILTVVSQWTGLHLDQIQ